MFMSTLLDEVDLGTRNSESLPEDAMESFIKAATASALCGTAESKRNFLKCLKRKPAHRVESVK
jgi:hypothetical protein